LANLWQRINIVNLTNNPLESQKLNDEIFSIYDKLNYLRCVGLNRPKPTKPLEGELWNDGEKINIYLGGGLGPQGDGFVPVAYIDPDSRYTLQDNFNTFANTMNENISLINSSINTLTISVDSLDNRVGTIETVNLPTINATLNTHATNITDLNNRVNNVSVTANSALNTANTALTAANTAQATANTAQTTADNALITANSAYTLATSLQTSVATLQQSVTALDSALDRTNLDVFKLTYYRYKVAVAFRESGGSITILWQKNVNSITYIAAGKYRINYTSDLNFYDPILVGNYSTTNEGGANNDGQVIPYSVTATSAYILVSHGGGTLISPTKVCNVLIFNYSSSPSNQL